MGRAQRTIGGIQPFAELAQGATTVVYKGYQQSLQRVVIQSGNSFSGLKYVPVFDDSPVAFQIQGI